MTFVQCWTSWADVVQMLYHCFVFAGIASILTDLKNIHSLEGGDRVNWVKIRIKRLQRDHVWCGARNVDPMLY